MRTRHVIPLIAVAATSVLSAASADAAAPLRVTAPDADDLVSSSARVVVRSASRASRFRARLDGRDVTASFRGTGTRRIGVLRGVRPGLVHLSVQARVGSRTRNAHLRVVVRGRRTPMLRLADATSGILRSAADGGVVRVAFRAPAGVRVTAKLNGRAAVLRRPDAKGIRRAVLARSDGLRRGRNRLVLSAYRDDGRWDVIRQRVVVARDAAMADAGRDVRAREGGRAALDARRSSSGTGGRMSYAWKVVHAPRGSRAAVAAPSAARTKLRLRRPGRYVVALTATERRRDGTLRRSTDLRTVEARAATPPLGARLDTMASADGGGTQVTVDSRSPSPGSTVGRLATFPAPKAGGARLYPLDSVSLKASAGYDGTLDSGDVDDSLAARLGDWSAGTLMVLVGRDGCCSKSKVVPTSGDFSAVFAYDGQKTKNVADTGTWNAGRKLGTVDALGPAGGLTGDLRWSSADGTFRFVQPDRLSYATDVPDRPTTGPADGATYRLLATDRQRAVDVDGAPQYENSLYVTSPSNAASQQWQLRSAYGGYYQLVNGASGMCMNLSGTDHSSVLQYPCTEPNGQYASNELWQLSKPDGAKGYTLTSLQTGQLVTATDAILEVADAAADDADQTFLLQPAAGTYVISDGAGQVMGMPPAANGNGANVQPRSTSAVQRWTLAYQDATSFSLTNVDNGNCLDVLGDEGHDGDTVGTFTCAPGASEQRWVADADASGVRITSSLRGNVLTRPRAGGVTVDQDGYTGQRWQLDRTEGGQSTTFRIGTRRYRADLPLGAAGFAVLAIDPAGRVLDGGPTSFITSNGPDAVSGPSKLAAELRTLAKQSGATVLVQSIGRPPVNNKDFTDVASAIVALGGDAGTVLQLDGSGDYAFAGCTDCSGTQQPMFSEQERRAAGSKVLGARLEGTLTRDGRSGFRADTGTSSDTDTTFGDLATRWQAGWPLDDGADGTAALRYVAQTLKLQDTCDADFGPVRNAYCSRNAGDTTEWTARKGEIKGLKVPAGATYTQATLDAVVDQVSTEFDDLAAVQQMMADYHDALLWTGSAQGTAQSIASVITADFQSRASSNANTAQGGWWSLIQDTLTFAADGGLLAARAPQATTPTAGEEPNPYTLVSDIMGVLGDLGGIAGGNDGGGGSSSVSLQVDTAATDYAAELDAQLKSLATNVVDVENVIVTDPVKLRAAAGNAPRWGVDETASPSLQKRLQWGAGRSLWTQLLPTGYDLWQFPLMPRDETLTHLWCGDKQQNHPAYYIFSSQRPMGSTSQAVTALDSASNPSAGSTYALVPGKVSQQLYLGGVSRDPSQPLLDRLLHQPGADGAAPNAGFAPSEIQRLGFKPVPWSTLNATVNCAPLYNVQTGKTRNWGYYG